MSLRWMNKEQNYITSASMLTPSTEKAGVAGAAIKTGTGAGALEAGGAYIGEADALYTVEIDSVSGGTEIGQASFRWKDGGVNWNATGLLTSEVPINLNNGVTIKFIGGAGDDFAQGDAWEFTAVKHFGRERLLDLDRGTAWRSAGLDNPDFITADLGQARLVSAAIIADHNFTAEAEIRLQANTSGTWTDPAYDQALTHHEGLIAVFPDQTYRYWRLAVTDSSNPDGFVSLGEFYLGSFLELSFGVILDDFKRGLVMSDPQKEAKESFAFDLFISQPSETQALTGFFRSLMNLEDGRVEPFFFCWDHSSASSATKLVRVESGILFVNTSRDYHRFGLSLIEEPCSNV